MDISKISENGKLLFLLFFCRKKRKYLTRFFCYNFSEEKNVVKGDKNEKRFYFDRTFGSSLNHRYFICGNVETATRPSDGFLEFF